MFMRPIGSSFEQESIPVGCVPSAAVAICWGGGGSSVRGVGKLGVIGVLGGGGGYTRGLRMVI